MPATGNSVRAADSRLEPIAVAIAVGAMAAVMFAAQRAGHWWGDDWALYLRQAQGVVDGHPGRVLAENEFAVQSSNGAAFSPPLYPWGFPLLLAPFVAVVGTDIDRLAIVPILSACAFSCAWYLLARPRVGRVAALAGMIAITLSPLLLGWSELIQSEWSFMAVAMWTLVVIDRRRGDWLTSRWFALFGIGLLAAAAFSVRREGIATIPAIAAAQLVAIADARPRVSRALVARVLLPHATGGIAVLLLQAILPSTVVPRYDGTSVWNMWRFRDEHVEHLAEIVGLKRPWDGAPIVLGSEVLGWVLAAIFLGVAAVGAVIAVTSTRRRDAHLAIYALAAFAVGGSFRVAVNRYMCTVAPILLLLAATFIIDTARRISRERAGRIVVALALTAIVAGNVANVHRKIDRAERHDTTGAIEWGPTHPDAVAMFDEVIALTDPDDVVAAPKARAMTFATGRLAVQVDRYRSIPDVDLALIVTEAGSAVAARLAEEPGRYRSVWFNRRFVIYAVL